jgi:hypothetical protein
VPAAEAGLLTETADGVRFAHALTREALYEGTPGIRRRVWHRAAAEAVLAAPNPDPDAVAHHLERAGDPRAAAWLVRAGERAQRAYAWLSAAARYEAALAALEAQGADATTRAWLLFRLARMRRYSDPGRALRDLAEAERLTAGRDPALGAALGFEQGLYRAFLGEVGSGLAAMAAGVAALDALPAGDQARLQALDRLSVAERRGTLILWLASAGRLAEAAALGEPYVAVAEAATGPRSSAHGDAYLGLGTVYVAWGRPVDARRASRSAREAYAAAGHHYQALAVEHNELSALVLTYETERLDERRRLASSIEAGGAGPGLSSRSWPPACPSGISTSWRRAGSRPAASRARPRACRRSRGGACAASPASC